MLTSSNSMNKCLLWAKRWAIRHEYISYLLYTGEQCHQ